MPFIPEEGNKVKFKVLYGRGERAGRGDRGGLAVTPKTLKCAFYLRLEAGVIKIPFLRHAQLHIRPLER
jgi:hypothetical protein